MSARRGMVHGAQCASVVGVLLAGGRSMRMGRAKHALTMKDGRSFAETVAAALRDACGCVVISGPSDVLPSLPHVRDLRVDCGPLAAIESVLMSGVAEKFAVCPCDVPFVTGEMLGRLAWALDEAKKA